MSKRSGILTSLAKSNFSNDPYIKLIDILLRYFEVYDLEFCSNHSEVFEALFMSKDKCTNEIIASENYILIRTLDRYIKRYNQLALNICVSHKEEFASLLNEFFDGK